eukprot:TRINITY_DN51146_c0_g1_i1.p1 TRINITY_DN51146_c0_g1~~TRINITY_DN51146_c0_g1_i1.p1  ORF type:complete len:312 (+),score=43.19 TRINITY_DN51146_c0_g1_i1:406-1341(+)
MGGSPWSAEGLLADHPDRRLSVARLAPDPPPSHLLRCGDAVSCIQALQCPETPASSHLRKGPESLEITGAAVLERLTRDIHLQFVVPQKLSYDFNEVVFYAPASNACTQSYNVLWFIVTRIIAWLLGIDCFLTKYRAATGFILTQDASFMNLVGTVVFLNQVLGVVDIRKTIQNRLYRFVFAGEDGVMSERELMRQHVWEAMIAHAICHEYRAPYAVAIMLSFSDDDFQLLTLDDSHGSDQHNEEASRKAAENFVDHEAHLSHAILGWKRDSKASQEEPKISANATTEEPKKSLWSDVLGNMCAGRSKEGP